MAISRARAMNINWNLNGQVTGTNTLSMASMDDVNAAILMDIRDELNKLNAILNCSRFLAIPATLRSIDRKVTKPQKKARR